MDFNKFAILARAFCLGLVLSVFASPTWAVHDLGTFELEGNAIDDAIEGDDWENIYHGTSSANVTTDPDGNGILEDPAPKSIFTGGRKDIQDISQWSHKDGAVPDKDDLTNAYAAAYAVDNDEDGKDLVIYFGADRFANKGDAFMGFWFFQDEVVAEPDGSFSGEHREGDILVLIDYPQGANAEPYAALVTWDTTCSKADSNDPAPEDCAAKNLRLVAETSGSSPADCNDVNPGDLGCATTNKGLEPIPSPWAYTPKDGESGSFPYESFYEGGVNLTQLLKGFGVEPGCFSSFMAETRSSASFTASLKDFVLGQFKLCGLELVKTCPTGTIQADGETILYEYELEVKNVGFGSIYEINATDITANAGDNIPNGDFMFYEASLAGNDSVTFTGSFYSTINGINNEAEVTAALQSGGSVALTAKDDVDCPDLIPDGGMYVEKDCDVLVAENVNGVYGLRVDYSGKVCSNSEYAIQNVDVIEVHDGNEPVVIKTINLLAPMSCENYSGSYIPVPKGEVGDGIAAEDVRTFSDTVDASGTFVLGGVAAEAIEGGASCNLCPSGP